MRLRGGWEGRKNRFREVYFVFFLSSFGESSLQHGLGSVFVLTDLFSCFKRRDEKRYSMSCQGQLIPGDNDISLQVHLCVKAGKEK